MNGRIVRRQRRQGALTLAVLAALSLMLVLGLGGCSKKQQQADISGMPSESVSDEPIKVADNDIPVAQPATEPSDVITGDMGLRPVFFDFDKYELTRQARETAQRQRPHSQGEQGPARDDRGPLRRARHHAVQPGPRREARPRGDGLPGEPRHRGGAHGDRLLRQGAALLDGSRRGAWAQNRRAHFVPRSAK